MTATVANLARGAIFEQKWFEGRSLYRVMK